MAQDPYFSGSKGCRGKVVGMKCHGQDNMAGKQQSQDSNPSPHTAGFCSFCCADGSHGNPIKLPKQWCAGGKENQDGKGGRQLPQPSPVSPVPCGPEQ